MTPTRSEFLWTMGTAAGAFALVPIEQMFWTPEIALDAGWTPGIEEWIRSSCLVCPVRCGITGRVVDGLLAALGVQALNILAGSINRPGGILFGEDLPLAPLAPVVPAALWPQSSACWMRIQTQTKRWLNQSRRV